MRRDTCSDGFTFLVAALVVLSTLLFGGVAIAQDSTTPTRTSPAADVDNRSGQIGIRLGLVGGLLASVGFSEGAVCNDGGDESCARFSGPYVDGELSYGITRDVELTLRARVGLIPDEAPDARPFRFAMGVRVWGAPLGPMKPYGGVRLLADITENCNPNNPNWGTFDVGLRGEVGLQLDVSSTIGFYVEAGESITLIRARTFLTDLGLGAQLRFP